MKAIYWFTKDLRLQDNPALALAAQADQLLCVFVVQPEWLRPGRYQQRAMNERRWLMCWQSVQALEVELKTVGQRLHIAVGDPAAVLPALCQQHGLDHLFTQRNPGADEHQLWSRLQQAMPQVRLTAVDQHGLFSEPDLPMALTDLPPTFSAFRRQIEKQNLWSAPVTPMCTELPPAPGFPEDARSLCPVRDTSLKLPMQAGSAAAIAHLNNYTLGQQHLGHYKITRNHLADPSGSSHLSAWLATGALSVRTVAQSILDYEALHGANESTYWLWFELLWREYFLWQAFTLQKKLFSVSRLQSHRQKGVFYPHRFKAWTAGSTEWPLVNAIMNQLRETGLISNRSRQIAASALIYDLGLDWRFGAAWFESCLLDYEVGSNWGNWQYIAGVGADPRGGRHFNIHKQTEQFDPNGHYIKQWHGVVEHPVQRHTVDAADWPLG